MQVCELFKLIGWIWFLRETIRTFLLRLLNILVALVTDKSFSVILDKSIRAQAFWQDLNSQTKTKSLDTAVVLFFVVLQFDFLFGICYLIFDISGLSGWGHIIYFSWKEEVVSTILQRLNFIPLSCTIPGGKATPFYLGSHHGGRSYERAKLLPRSFWWQHWRVRSNLF